MKNSATLVSRLRSLPDAIATEAADRIEYLEAWLIPDCECPCCLETQQCSPGCTFATDAPSDYERMIETRTVVFAA